MRIIQTNCTIRYTGRCDTFLPEALRLIIIKDDGSVAIHVDSGIKPLNYMKASKQLGFIEQDGHLILHAGNSKEELFVDMLDVVYDEILPFPDSEREMEKTGTEDLLQEEISRELSLLDPRLEFVCREFETGKGPVDILGRTKEHDAVALIEVKRHAHRKDVYQVIKYANAIDNMVSDARKNDIDAIEAKTKGDHDGAGVMISVNEFANRELYLAGRTFARGTIDEAIENGVAIIEVPDNNDENTVMYQSNDGSICVPDMPTNISNKTIS